MTPYRIGDRIRVLRDGEARTGTVAAYRLGDGAHWQVLTVVLPDAVVVVAIDLATATEPLPARPFGTTAAPWGQPPVKTPVKGAVNVR